MSRAAERDGQGPGAERVRTAAKKLATKLVAGPPYHVGPVLPNALGLQVARASLKHTAWHLRPKSEPPEHREHVELMNRDGIVVIPDFYSPEVFEEIRGEVERSRQVIPYRTDYDFATQVDEAAFLEGSSSGDLPVAKAIEQSTVIYDNPELFPAIRAHLSESPFVRAIVSGAVRRNIRLLPQALVQIWQRADEGQDLVPDVARTRPRGEYMLHADTHYPTLKAWLYLNDIDEGNGAFVYAKGSHLMTRHRLRYEYDASIRVARSKHDGAWQRVPYGHTRGPGDELMARLVQSPICGKANTLVIANTSGFHRRGEFTSDRPRETIHLNFRNTEGLLNRVTVPTGAARTLGFSIPRGYESVPG